MMLVQIKSLQGLFCATESKPFPYDEPGNGSLPAKVSQLVLELLHYSQIRYSSAANEFHLNNPRTCRLRLETEMHGDGKSRFE
jgi:hypothetical protein